jgi:hypothetical protein
MRITGAIPLDDVSDVPVSIDDRVRLVGEFRVVSVRHFVDPKTGDLIREQILKPLTADLTPWNPNDPTDQGILRAQP